MGGRGVDGGMKEGRSGIANIEREKFKKLEKKESGGK